MVLEVLLLAVVATPGAEAPAAVKELPCDVVAPPGAAEFAVAVGRGLGAKGGWSMAFPSAG